MPNLTKFRVSEIFEINFREAKIPALLGPWEPTKARASNAGEDLGPN